MWYLNAYFLYKYCCSTY